MFSKAFFIIVRNSCFKCALYPLSATVTVAVTVLVSYLMLVSLPAFFSNFKGISSCFVEFTLRKQCLSLSFFTVSFTLPSWSVKVNSNSSAFNSRPVFFLALILTLAFVCLFVTVLIVCLVQQSSQME